MAQNRWLSKFPKLGIDEGANWLLVLGSGCQFGIDILPPKTNLEPGKSCPLIKRLAGGFKYCLFSSLPGEMIHFD